VVFKRQPGGNFERSSLSENNLEGLFSGADKSRIDLDNLRTIDGQQITSPSGGIISNPEAAGVLTSRQFLKEHAFLGTNRRLVQYAFKNFLCKDITEMRVGGGVGERFINRDVSRAPGGDRGVYRSDCRTCHGVLDPFRRAFAFFDFVGANQETGRPSYQANQVVEKINRNIEFSGGARVPNNLWFNLASSGSNASHFGWNWAGDQNAAHHQGAGASQFGLLISRARAFSSCAVEQVWEAVCKKPGKVIPNNVKSQLSNQFVQENHNLKRLFVEVAAHPLCLGEV
jgi:hypothetical protein